MALSDLFPHSLWRWLRGAKQPDSPLSVVVTQLHERDRHRMMKHFLALEKGDRLLRFGSVLKDELVQGYVSRIDFSRDMVYGVYNRVFKLVGVGHLGFAPNDSAAPTQGVSSKDQVAEFGVSVARSVRGMGVGSKLFERAAMHCRNNDVDTLYMHCLSSNQTMIHIAKKAGMTIQREYGEADAYLKLLPPNPASVMKEAVDEQLALFDYTLKANTRAAAKWLERLPGRKER